MICHQLHECNQKKNFSEPPGTKMAVVQTGHFLKATKSGNILATKIKPIGLNFVPIQRKRNLQASKHKIR